MVIQDDRTKEEKQTHNFLVVGTDSFMSGWGRAKNGVSYAAWACRYEHLDKVEKWVRSRSEQKRVRVVDNSWRPRGIGHTHIYVVGDDHTSLN